MIELNITTKDVCCDMRPLSKEIRSDSFSDGTEYLDKIIKSCSNFQTFKRVKEQ
jgi:hypothetical protein